MTKNSATWALALSLATCIAGAVSVSEARTVFDASAALRGWIVPSGKADDVPVPGLMFIVR